MILTLADVRASRIPRVLGVCPTDVRVVEFVNEATQRLLTKGHWWGSYGRFRICATEGCLTLPPQIAAIERASICGQPVRVHDQWYEFLENGYGIRTGGSSNSGDSSSVSCTSGACAPCFGMSEALQRGTYPTFGDIRGVNKKLNFTCDFPTDVGKEVLALGYDENANWIRTEQDGVIKDGELVALAQSAGTTSNHFFSSVTGLQIPDDMDGQWWLYEYNNDTAFRRMLGWYQYFETRPNYQRYFFPSIGAGSAENEDGDCTLTTVDLIAKLDFIPVKNDTDYLIIGNLPALKDMSRAIYLAENEPDGEKAERLLVAGERMALRELDAELDHYLGQRVVGVDIVGASVGFTQPVENLL